MSVDLAEGRRLEAAAFDERSSGLELRAWRDWAMNNAAALLAELDAARRDADALRANGAYIIDQLCDSCLLKLERGKPPAAMERGADER